MMTLAGGWAEFPSSDHGELVDVSRTIVAKI